MTPSETLSMYENIAGLTNKMVQAAHGSDWNGLTNLEAQCAQQARGVETGVPALTGAQRMRKIDLLKMILANDREIRDVTEPWMTQVSSIMQGAAAPVACAA